jgi:putative membrane protein
MKKGIDPGKLTILIKITIYSEERKMLKLKSIPKTHLYLLLILFLIFIWSAFKPDQLKTWFLEVIPVILGIIIIIYTYNRFRLTTPIYVLLWLGAIIILIGGHYSYGKVPIFNWFKDHFQLGRNYYDRFGHLFGGLVWAMTIKEILLRKAYIENRKLLVILIIGLVLGVSASYELVEGFIALIMGGAEDFIGLQGDIWDTHWDMFLALLGAIGGLLSLSSIHDRYLAMIDVTK